MIAALFASLAFLSLGIVVWQWIAGRRFPLHRRIADPALTPPVTLLKPLKGHDAETQRCLASWLAQQYAGPIQVLFGVSSSDDPVCDVVRHLLAAYPRTDAQLVVCAESLGTNAKVSTLAQLHRHAKHDILVVSDADVRVPADLVANVVAPLRSADVGLVHCLYRLENPGTPAMRWEAVAVNADFWSSVLQARSLGPLDFALGATMAVPRKRLAAVGGFEAVVNHLADDYQLGNRIARSGARIEFCPVVVECCEPPANWTAVWLRQLRWARTIRACKPLPYFLSIIANATLWPLLWLLASIPGVAGSYSATRSEAIIDVVIPDAVPLAVAVLAIRTMIAMNLFSRLAPGASPWPWCWMVPVKDLLGALLWLAAFLGNQVVWRGRRYRVSPGGRLKLSADAGH